MRQKEEQIVWQNQSHLSRQWFVDHQIRPDLLDICLVTDVLVQFCQLGPTKEVKERMETMKQYLSKKYGKKI